MMALVKSSLKNISCGWILATALGKKQQCAQKEASHFENNAVKSNSGHPVNSGAGLIRPTV